MLDDMHRRANAFVDMADDRQVSVAAAAVRGKRQVFRICSAPSFQKLKVEVERRWTTRLRMWLSGGI